MRFLKSIVDKFAGRPVDWDELEESLIRADLGVSMMQDIIEKLQSRQKSVTANDIIEVTREEIVQILPY